MASTTNRIVVEVGADVRDFKSGFDDAVKSLSGFGNVIRGFQEKAGGEIFDKLKEAAQALPSALMAATSRVMAMGDRLADLSTSTGMGIEALQDLELAGSMVGVSLDSALGSVTILNKNIISGSKDTANALSQLGLSGAQLRGMGADEALAAVGDKLRELPTQSDRAAAGMALFGKSWSGVAALVLSGTNQLKDKAKELGVSYEAMAGIMTKEVAGAAAELADKSDILKLAWTGLLDNFGNAVVSSQAVHDAVDGLIKIIASLSEGVARNQESIQYWIEQGLWAALKLMAAAGGVITTFLYLLEGLAGAFTVLSGVALNAGASTARFLAVMADKAGMTGKADWLRETATSLEAMSSKAQDFGSKMTAEVQKARQASGELTLALWDLSTSIGEGKVKLDLSGDAAARSGKAYQLLAEDSKKAQDILTGLTNELATMEAAGLSPLAQAFQALDAKAAAAMDKLGELKDKLSPAEFSLLADAIGAARIRMGELTVEAVKLQVFGPTVSTVTRSMSDLADMAQVTGLDMDKLTDESLLGLIQKLEDLVDAGAESESGMKLLADATAEASERGYLFGDAALEATIRSQEWATAIEKHNEELKKSEERLRANVEAAYEWADSLAELGSTFEGAFGTGLSMLGGFLGILATLNDDTKQLALNWANVAMVATGAIAAIRKGSANERSGGKRALGGAMTGAAAGAAFGPWGAVIGGLAGGILGFFSGPSWAGAAKAAGRVLGAEVSNELAEAINDTALDLNISAEDASLLFINDFMAETGTAASEMTGQMMALLGGIADGSIPAAEGTRALGESFAALADEVMATSDVGSNAMVGLIVSARAAGVEVAQISAFVNEQLTKAQGGVGAMIASFTGESAGKDAEFISGIQLNTAQQAQDQGTIFAAVFWASVKEQGIVQASDAMREPFERLYESISTVGTTALSDQILGPMKRIMDLTAEGGLFRGAAEGAEGLRAALDGLSASGYLTVDSFTAIQNQAQAAFEQMVAGGATSQEALLASGPLLQDIVAASQEYGIALDSNTESLVAQAREAGVAFPEDPMNRMVDLLEIIARQLGADLPAATQAAGSAFEDTLGESAAGVGEQMQSTFDQTASVIEDGFANAADAAIDAIAPLPGEFDLMGRGILSSMDAAVDGMAEAFDAMAAEAETGADAVADFISDLNELEVTIPVNYEANGDIPNGWNPNPGGQSEPERAASGFDAILRSDKLFKGHANERVTIMPVGGANPNGMPQTSNAERGGGFGFGGGPSIVYSPTIIVNGAGNDAEIRRAVDEALRDNLDGLQTRVREAAVAA